MIRLLGVFIFFLAVGQAAFAATSDFTITQLIGADTTPPTTPGTLSATYVAVDQINISWGASTDNYILGGYQVYRDGSQIATTTLTTYADSGLASSTLYTYYVRAFDSSFNFSSSSNSVATTTLTAPTSTPVVDNGSSGGVAMELESLQVTPNITSAEIRWETSRYARFELRWGETDAYELGFVTNDVYQHKHETLITELEPNTTYAYELLAFDRRGVKTVLVRDQFTTTAYSDTESPANVARFTARAEGVDVLLTWQNPTTDFNRVRIVRNPLTFPTDPNNGFVVYEGDGVSYRDQDILQSSAVVYYTAFAFDAAGNRSSGAVAWATRVDGGGDLSAVPVAPPVVEVPSATATVPLVLSLEEVRIVQDSEVIAPVDDTFLVDTSRAFVIQAPTHMFPRHLKTIQVTLRHPVDTTIEYSYLLRINANKTAYIAKIDQLGFVGTIPLELQVYDYRTQERAQAGGFIISTQSDLGVPQIIETTKNTIGWWWLPLVILLLLVLILWRNYRKA